jgi:hypothetical protein
MHPNPTVLNDGTADQSYDFRGITANETSQYKDATAPLDQPQTLTIKHTSSGSGLQQTRRSLFRLDHTVEDDDGNQAVLSAYVVLALPEKVATSTQATKILEELKDFLTNTGNIGRIIAGDL